MTGPVILHAPGDGLAAGRLAEGLSALAPVVCGPASYAAAPAEENAPLILFWSPRAAASSATELFTEAAEAHAGPVFVCLSYGDDPPEALAEYRLIAPDIDVAEFNAALRAQQIFAREQQERAALHAGLERRRARGRSGRAFAGGAVMGFATSVALVGALGAGAISAAGQLGGQPSGDGDLPGLPLGMPVIQPLVRAADAADWSDAKLTIVSYAEQVAHVEQQLALADERMRAAPQPRVIVETRFAAVPDEMWRPATSTPPTAVAHAAPAAAPLAPMAPIIQVAAIDDAKVATGDLLEIPDLAPDFWRIVAGPADADLAKVPAPTLISDFGADDGLWRPS